MSDELDNNPTPKKTKRQYNRVAPPNPQVAELESGLIPLVNLRLEANRKIQAVAARANQANAELADAQNAFQQIESEIQYRMQLIGQLKNGGMPVPQTPYVAQNWSSSGFAPSSNQQSDQRYGYAPPSSPYNPVTPYPTMPPAAPGVGSYPAPNRGLYPDATERLESALDFQTPELRAEFEGRRR